MQIQKSKEEMTSRRNDVTLQYIYVEKNIEYNFVY